MSNTVLMRSIAPFGFFHEDKTVGALTELADEPLGQNGASAVVVGDDIFVIGGSRNFKKYVISRNTWTILDNLADTSSFAPVVEIDGMIYTFGSTWNTYTRVRSYNIEKNLWTSLVNGSVDAFRASAVAINGEMYVAGGNEAPYTQLRKYIPKKNTWITLQDCPINARSSLAVAINEEMYVVGGSETPYNQLRKYNPQTDTWEELKECPAKVQVGLASATTTNGNLYVIVGEAKGNYSRFYEYCVSTNEWYRLKDVPVSANRLATVALNGEIYILGGDGNSDIQFRKFNPPSKQIVAPAKVGQQVFYTARAGQLYLNNKEIPPNQNCRIRENGYLTSIITHSSGYVRGWIGQII